MVNSIVFDVAMADLYILKSNISGIFTNFSSPVVYIENDASATDTIILNITNSSFSHNQAVQSAGVVYALNTDVYIDTAKFLNNAAWDVDAGALYLDCDDSAVYACSYIIKNSQFINNSALVDGGAIKYTYYRPDISVNNTFDGNTAMYGQTMASYPVQMFIVQNTSSARRRLDMLSQDAVRAMGITNGVVFQLDTPLVSGSLITSNITLKLVDDTNRTLITDNSSVAVMSSNSSSVQVMKSKSVTAVSGIFTFDDVIIIGPPGTDILLKITSESII